MADRFPLILNTSANQIQEIASGDQLDLTGNNIANAGIITASTVNVTGDLDVDGHINLDNISISGVTTFSGPIDLNSDLDVDGHTNLDNVSVSGVLTATTFSGDGSGLIGVASTDNIVTGTAATFNTYPVDINAGLTIAGVSTFTGALNIDSDIDVDGHTNLDNVNIVGVSTFTGNIDANGDLDVDGHTNLDNVNIAGVTTFAGAVNAASILSTAIDLNGDLDVDGHTNLDNVSIAGVVTAGTLNATTFGPISGTTAAFSGNVSIGGTLTYEDVTNIDSVGVVTAREGIFIPDNKKLHIGNTSGSGDLQLFHDTNNSYIRDIGTGSLLVGGNNLYLTNNLATGYFLQAINGAQVDLYHNNQIRITTTQTGAVVSGILTASSFEGDGSNLSGISVGITTEALVKTHGQTASLDLSKDDHKVTATGTVTIDVTGGTEAGSHTLRIVNSGIATVGFSTYFLFPSGGAPNIPVTSGTISLISFTVHRAGAVGVSTQLLSGASVSFA